MRAITFSIALALSAPAFAAYFSLPAYMQTKEGYSWKHETKEEKMHYTVHVLRLKSQTWRTSDTVDRHLWEHEVRLTIPKNLRHTTALVHVGGGKVGTEQNPTDPILIGTAVTSGTILAEISLIPVQPLQFTSEEKGRSEDAIVAYTWRKYLETKEPTWPLHLPMAKAIVRAMDSVQEYCRDQNLLVPEKFVLMGESKRAWASWLTAASDHRVGGIVPIVCDFLNVKASYTHHYRSFGGWSPAIKDYVNEGFNAQMLHGEDFAELLKIEDPYSYRHAYTMPKFIINSAGDPFSCPDSSHFYFSELPSPKYLRYLPNSGHKLPREEIYSSASAFYLGLVEKTPLPHLIWEKKNDGSLHVATSQTPLRAVIWRAKNPDARDFRFDFTKVRWQSEPVVLQKDGSCTVSPSPVEKGWSAFFVEYIYPHPFSAELPPLTFTTEVMISPHTLPHAFPVSK